MASIKKNFAYNILLNLSRVIFPFITAPYISRVLSPDGVGLFNFANTYADYFALFALLGIPKYGIRETAKRHDSVEELSALVSELISISFITTITMTIIYIASICFIGQLNENRILFLVSGFLLYLSPFRIDWFYSGLEQFRYITLRTIFIRIISIVCLFIFVRNKGDLIVYVILNVAGIVVGDVWNFGKMIKYGIKPHLTFHGLKKHFPSLFILFAANIAISIYTILDTFMLGFMTDYREVGFYNNAMYLSKALIVLVTSLAPVTIPRISQYCKIRDNKCINDLANKSFLLISFFAVPMAVGTVCVADTFVPLFFGTEFIGSIIPLKILSMIVISVGLSNLLGLQILVAMNLEKLFLYSLLTGSVTNLFMNLLTIPRFGAIGASISSLIVETTIVIIMLILVYKNTSIRFNKSWVEALKSVCGAVFFVPVLIFLRIYFDGWILIGISVLCGCIVYGITQIILKNSALILVKPIVKKLFLSTKIN